VRLAASRLDRFAARSGSRLIASPLDSATYLVAVTSILGSGQVWGRPEFAQRIVSFVAAGHDLWVMTVDCYGAAVRRVTAHDDGRSDDDAASIRHDSA
jgi:hypothetical protein